MANFRYLEAPCGGRRSNEGKTRSRPRDDSEDGYGGSWLFRFQSRRATGCRIIPEHHGQRSLSAPVLAIRISPSAWSRRVICGVVSTTQRASAKVTRTFRGFRAHGLIAKIPHTRRWRVTTYGRRIMGSTLYLRLATSPTSIPGLQGENVFPLEPILRASDHRDKAERTPTVTQRARQ
jgi:hypothetical protein